jgi:DNA-binding transcriptional LysR family regulator
MCACTPASPPSCSSLPEDLGAFIRDHGGVKIDLEEHLSTEVVRAVREGAADLGICNASALTTAGASELQSLPYRQDQLVLIVPAGHPLSGRGALPFEDSLDFDHVGLHANSSIYLAMHQAATQSGRAIRLRIHVTGLDAMCRMIHNGLGPCTTRSGTNTSSTPKKTAPPCSTSTATWCTK